MKVCVRHLRKGAAPWRPLAAGRPAAQPREVGLHRGLVEEHQPLGLLPHERLAAPSPIGAPPRHWGVAVRSRAATFSSREAEPLARPGDRRVVHLHPLGLGQRALQSDERDVAVPRGVVWAAARGAPGVGQRAAGGDAGGHRRSSEKVRVARPGTGTETTMTGERMALIELVETEARARHRFERRAEGRWRPPARDAGLRGRADHGTGGRGADGCREGRAFAPARGPAERIPRPRLGHARRPHRAGDPEAAQGSYFPERPRAAPDGREGARGARH
jgi:hypothetical protein